MKKNFLIGFLIAFLFTIANILDTQLKIGYYRHMDLLPAISPFLLLSLIISLVKGKTYNERVSNFFFITLSSIILGYLFLLVTIQWWITW